LNPQAVQLDSMNITSMYTHLLIGMNHNLAVYKAAWKQGWLYSTSWGGLLAVASTKHIAIVYPNLNLTLTIV